MVKKASVYTRSGDKGLTSLVGGTRINKSDPQIDLYGEVDELNSFIGLSSTYIKEFKSDSNLLALLHQIQNKLFDLGSNLACEPDKRGAFKLAQITNSDIKLLEKNMDEMDASLEVLKQFILPGGCRASSSLHICRTICRRLERKICLFENLPINTIEYINRLSDFLFISARYMNKQSKVDEICWGLKD